MGGVADGDESLKSRGKVFPCRRRRQAVRLNDNRYVTGKRSGHQRRISGVQGALSVVKGGGGNAVLLFFMPILSGQGGGRTPAVAEEEAKR